MNEPTSLLWIALFIVVSVAVGLDLFLYRHSGREITSRRALAETAAWVSLALLFDLWIFHVRGHQASIEFLTGYLIEKVLSIDNIFLFLVIFRSFGVPPHAQHRALYYGVAGALALRAMFVFAGVALLDHFSFVTYIFGAVLLLTALRMLRPRRKESSEAAWIVRIAGRFLPVTSNAEGERFFLRDNGKWMATSLFLALLTIETADVIFAADSIPAVLSITRDTFIAYSSNVFAVLGLRAIYFVLAGILRRIRFLHQGLAAVLVFTGLKMIFNNRISLPDEWSLLIIAAIFTLAVIASAAWPAPASDEVDRAA